MFKNLKKLLIPILSITPLSSQVYAQSDVQSLADSNICFAIDLFKRLSSDSGNIFISPYSISVALAMTCKGAKAETEKEMTRVLHFNNDSTIHQMFSKTQHLLDSLKDDKNKLFVANSIWPQKTYTFLPDYIYFLKENYRIEVTYVDYVKNTEEARQTINSWVADKTSDKIKDLLQPGILDPLTRLVLTNAIYFKGVWVKTFDKKLTTVRDFFLTSGDSVKVPLMEQKGLFGYSESEGVKLLEIPYSGNEFSMILFLPEKKDGLLALESQLSLKTLKRKVAALQKQEIFVRLPKFRMEKSIQLNETLKSMGMQLAFSDMADFSGMDGTKDLFISDVVHKAFVDANEEGTEAAAATGSAMSLRSAPRQQPKTFIADHPFLFLIRHNATNTILFAGRVADPRS